MPVYTAAKSEVMIALEPGRFNGIQRLYGVSRKVVTPSATA
jgi:hypothetical protein